MAMYQFLIAVRAGANGQQSMLTNEAGEVTSHIQGMFNRTIKMMSSGIKPVYVFDGKPPELKGGELAKRLARRAKAQQELEEAQRTENLEDVDRFSRRLVKVTKQHNEDCRELLRLMGVPVLIAPCEAEAQCAELAKKNKVYATATEDMDALTFRSPKLVRKLTFSQTSKDKQPILEIDFEVMIRGMGLTYEQFVDLCILCGCDYCSTIKGIGPKTALKMIRQHKTLENVVSALKKEKKYSIPSDWFPQKVRKGELEELAKKEEEEAAKKEAEAAEIAAAAAAAAASAAASASETKSASKEVEDAAVEGEEETKDVVNELGDDILVDTDDEADHAAVEEEDYVPTNTNQDDDVAIEDEEEVKIHEGEEDEYEIIPPLYVQARKLFVDCEVLKGETVELKWTEPNEEALKEFLVGRMGFDEKRVLTAIQRLKEAQQQKAQKRMDRY